MNTRTLFPVGLLALLALLLFWFLNSGDASGRKPDPSPVHVASGEPAGAVAGPDSAELSESPRPVGAAEQDLQKTRQILPGESARTTARAWPEEETRWVDVHVIFPDDTPVSEAAWVAALSAEPALEGQHEQDWPFAQLHAGEDAAHIDDVLGAARVDANGRARLGLPPDTGAAWLAVGGSYVYSLDSQRIEVEAVDETVELRPVLGALISGSLLAPPGQPDLDLAGVEVKIRWSLGAALQLGMADVDFLNRETVTDPEGRFVFHAVPVGKPQTVATKSELLAATFSQNLKATAGEHVQVELAVLVGGSLTGRVVDEAGQVVAGAEVQALGRVFFGNPTAGLRETESDAEGRFHLKAITPGPVFLRVRHDDFQDSLSSPFDLLDGEERDEGDVVLDEGLIVAGVVTYPDGAPAVGTIVTLEPDLSENLAGNPVDPKDYIGAKNHATANEEGVFRIAGAGPGPWVVSAEVVVEEEGETEHASGRWAATLEVVRAPAENLSLALAPPIHVQGAVVDGQGLPVTAFGIQGERSGSQWYMPPTEERSEDFMNEEGSFRLTDLRAGTWTFVAVAEGYANSTEVKLDLPSDEPLAFALLRPVLLAGRVLDPEGRPVAGAEVSEELEGTEVFEAMQGRGDWPTTKSDAKGNFKLEGLAPGAGSIVAKKDGFAPSEAVAFELTEGQESLDLVLSMRRGGVITGEVFGADGKPSGGCMLILQMPTMAERRITNTGPDGRFSERGLTPGQWQIQAFPGIESLQSESGEALDQATLLAALKMTTVKLEDEQEEHVVLGEPPANPVRVHGRVTLGDAPVEDTIISFVPAGGGGMAMLKIKPLDEDGGYEVQLDEPGEYLVTIQTASVPGRQNSVEFRRAIPEGEEHRLDFEMPLGRVSGLVIGPDGAPRSKARVTLNMEGGLVFGTVFGGQYNETVTDADGEFDIPYLRPGNYIVAAGGAMLGGLLGDGEGLGRVVTSVSVKEGQWVRGVDFRLEDPGAIQGTVRDSAGALVKGASIFLRDENGRLVELFSFSQTNASGGFEYSALAPGEYTVIARTPTQASAGGTPVRVRSGESTDVTVVVDAGTVLLVTLIDKSGANVPSRVSVLGPDGNELNGMLGMTEIMERYSGGLGSTVQRVGPVPPGAYRVRAFASDGRSIERTVTVKGKAERKVKLRLK